MGYPYVDVIVRELLRLIFLPYHVPFGGLLVQADPAFELLLGCHGE